MMLLSTSVLTMEQASINGLLPVFESPGEVLVAFCFSNRPSKISKWVWPRLLETSSLSTETHSVRFYAPPLRGEPLYPTAFWLCSGGSSSYARPPSLGSLTWAQNSHTCMRSSAINLFSSLWVTHLGTWELVTLWVQPSSLWFLLYVFGCRISLLVGSSLFYWWRFNCEVWFWYAFERRWA